MSTLSTTNIKHPSSASNNIVLDASGNVALQAGSASAPALQPSGDSNTGVLFPAADTVAVSTGGTERLRVDSSGRLLVGTSSSRDVVIGNSTGWPAQNQVASIGNNNIGLSLFSWSTYAVDLGGGAGVGPDIVLARSNSGTEGTHAAVTNGMLLGRINFNGSNGTAFANGACISAASDGQTWASGDCPARLVFSTCPDSGSSPVERMRISNAGQILLASQGTESSPTISWLNDTNTGIYCPSSDSIALATAGTSKLSINSLGAVTSSFTITNNEAWVFNNTNTSTNFSLSFRTNNIQRGYISVTDSAVAYNTSSDYRLKENIVRIADGITRLQQLKPSRFNFIVDPNRIVDGFLAHEVQAVVPEAITGEKDAVDDDGNPIYQGIDQSKLVPLLTAALQEAIGEIESLKARLTAAGI